MKARERIVWVLLIVLGITLIVSLAFNDVHHKRLQRENRYVELSVNRFIFNMFFAGQQLGEINADVNYQRAAVDTSDAANVLNDFYTYESMVQNDRSPTAQQESEIADFLSYVSLALVSQNTEYKTSQGMITLSPREGKSYILKANTVLHKYMVNSNIPVDKMSTVMNQIYNLIPSDFRITLHFPVLEFWNF